MMSLKPYISLQQKDAVQSGKMKIYYLGVTISVPNGFVLYQRKPQLKPDSKDTAQVRFLLFAATSQINSHPNDYLFYFNKADKIWKNLTSIEVEVSYLESSDYAAGEYPIYDPFDYGVDDKYDSDEKMKRVGFAKVAVANAVDDLSEMGLLFQEEGLGWESHIPNVGYPNFPIIDKLARRNVARSVGGGTGDPPKGPPGWPPGGGGQGG